jgi:hypothetical protein
MPWMMPRVAPELGARLILAALLSVPGLIDRSARAQDEPDPEALREMPDILPEAPDDTVPAGADSSPVTKAEPEPAPDEAPHAALRLEAQLLGAMALPFGGNESGAAFGFAITYGAGWGEIPILIGIDFMSIGRSNTATARASGDAAAMSVTRTSSDRLFDFDLWLRVQPPRWPVRPYAEAFVGAKFVRTQWSIARDDGLSFRGSDNAWTSALGWGVGVDFMGLFSAVGAFSLTLGMRRLHGSQVRLERPIVSNGGTVAKNREVSTNETIFIAGLCGRYDFGEAD